MKHWDPFNVFKRLGVNKTISIDNDTLFGRIFNHRIVLLLHKEEYKDTILTLQEEEKYPSRPRTPFNLPGFIRASVLTVNEDRDRGSTLESIPTTGHQRDGLGVTHRRTRRDLNPRFSLVKFFRSTLHVREEYVVEWNTHDTW